MINILIIIFLFFSNAAAQEVIVYNTEKLPWFDTAEALGSLKAKDSVILTSTVTDTITKIHFEDGQRVTKGTVLAEMTDAEESALVKDAVAQLNEAKKQFQRIKDLPKGRAISASLYDQTEREFRSSQARLAAVQSRLTDRLILAPFDGVVGLKNISEGALVEPGDEITTVTDDSSLKLDLSVPSVFLSFLKENIPITARTDAFPGKDFYGEVKSIDSVVDPETRSIIVRATLPNPELNLKPGLLMSVFLEYNQRDSIVIPEEAIIAVGKGKSVFTVDKESSEVTSVEVESSNRKDGLVEITSGLSENTLVVTHGLQKIKPGAVVKITGQQELDGNVANLIKK